MLSLKPVIRNSLYFALDAEWGIEPSIFQSIASTLDYSTMSALYLFQFMIIGNLKCDRKQNSDTSCHKLEENFPATNDLTTWLTVGDSLVVIEKNWRGGDVNFRKLHPSPFLMRDVTWKIWFYLSIYHYSTRRTMRDYIKLYCMNMAALIWQHSYGSTHTIASPELNCASSSFQTFAMRMGAVERRCE